MLPWIVGVILIGVVLFILDREIYFYEAAHLGPRVQGWLYDRWAAKYDEGKHASQSQDADVLARPLIAALAEIGTSDALVLDVATGTGRLPAALLAEPTFGGDVIALDLSREMLVQAAAKLAPYRDRVTLIRHTALPLPFLDASFDAVCCLEALELMPNMEPPLAELARVLRPGGILLTTRGTEASGRVNKIASTERFSTLLHAAGFERIEIIPWWKNFNRVWARKPGQSAPVDSRGWMEVVPCPSCGRAALRRVSARAVRCDFCSAELSLSPEGIILC
jgi:ubiquinone/menaquinone biosynthesis C-methylase UbiE